MRATEFLTELWTQPYQLESRVIGPMLKVWRKACI